MPEKLVLAIVVTYNRLELLKRCVQYLQQQTLMPDILVINNSSTDGTEEYLKENNIGHVTQENSGSAGGWSRGLAEGWSRGYKYVWMMDDDGFPDKQALEKLLKKIDKETICISSVVVKENAPEELVFPMPRLNSNKYPVIFAAKRKLKSLPEIESESGTYPYAHPFNGALIDLERAKAVGDIDRNFFMFGDEVDYFFRMRNNGKVLSATDALHYHPDVSQRVIDKKKVYYYIRNTIILNHQYFDMALIRDFFTLGVAMYRILKRNGVTDFFSYFFGSNRKYFYQAIADAARGRRINRF